MLPWAFGSTRVAREILLSSMFTRSFPHTFWVVGAGGAGKCRAGMCKPSGAVSLQEKSMLLLDVKLLHGQCMLSICCLIEVYVSLWVA